MSDKRDSSGVRHTADGDVVVGDSGVDEYYLMHIDHVDGVATFGLDAVIDWDGDNFTVTSPHTPVVWTGWAGSLIVNHLTGQSAEVVRLLREMEGLPRETRVPIPWQ